MNRALLLLLVTATGACVAGPAPVGRRDAGIDGKANDGAGGSGAQGGGSGGQGGGSGGSGGGSGGSGGGSGGSGGGTAGSGGGMGGSSGSGGGGGASTDGPLATDGPVGTDAPKPPDAPPAVDAPPSGTCTDPTADKNGVAYIPLAGFRYTGGKERFDWTENFQGDSMRHDFENTPEGNQCLVGYFIVSGDDEISAKLQGGPHNDTHPTWADVYDVGITNFAGNRARLRYEETHPDYTGGINGLSFNVGNITGKWTGAMSCKLNVDDNADGKTDRVWVLAWVDPDGIDSAGKPKNKWVPTFDKKIALGDVPLKSPTEPYVCTIGQCKESQATLRIDGQGSSYKYQYLAYRSPVWCTP